ncbi:MAG TPA: RpiB/LacA/LacB family sugar-phosphate isomerase, partial [Sphingomicrobium sp.]
MRIALAADHAGYTLKDELVRWLSEQGHEVEDLGTNGPDSVDYP